MNNSRNHVNDRSTEDPSSSTIIKRTFTTQRKIKNFIHKEIQHLTADGINLLVNDDKSSDKLKVTIEGKDKEQISQICVSLFDKIGKKQEFKKRIQSPQKEEVLVWDVEMLANFMVKTGCNIHTMVYADGTRIVLVKGWTGKEVDEAVAQISVDNNNVLQQIEEAYPDVVTVPYLSPLNLLVIGMEGVGRTTLINSLVNYVKYNTVQEAQLNELSILAANSYHVSNGDEDVQIEMKTTTREPTDDLEDVIVYSFNATAGSQARSIQLIDTKGISECGEFQENLDHVDTILECVKKMGNLHGILLVINASSDRIPLNFIPVIETLFSKLHHNIQRNVMFCFTRAGPLFKPETISRAVKDMLNSLKTKNDILIEFNSRQSFCFDNSGFTQLYASIALNSPEVIRENATSYWEKSCSEAKRMFQLAAQFSPLETSCLIIGDKVQQNEHQSFNSLNESSSMDPVVIAASLESTITVTNHLTENPGILSVHQNSVPNVVDNQPVFVDTVNVITPEDEKKENFKDKLTPELCYEHPYLNDLPNDLEKQLVAWLLLNNDHNEKDRHSIIQKIVGKPICDQKKEEEEKERNQPKENTLVI